MKDLIMKNKLFLFIFLLNHIGIIISITGILVCLISLINDFEIIFFIFLCFFFIMMISVVWHSYRSLPKEMKWTDDRFEFKSITGNIWINPRQVKKIIRFDNVFIFKTQTGSIIKTIKPDKDYEEYIGLLNELGIEYKGYGMARID